MLEMLGRSSNQFSVRHTGRCTSLTSPPYTEYWSRLPARHLRILSPSAYATLTPLLRHCLDHPERLRRYESHVSDQPSSRSTGPGCLRDTCPS